jgi:hypothetical protein
MYTDDQLITVPAGSGDWSKFFRGPEILEIHTQVQNLDKCSLHFRTVLRGESFNFYKYFISTFLSRYYRYQNEMCLLFLRVIFLDFSFYVRYSTLLISCPSDSTVSEVAGIEPRTVGTTALAVRRSNLPAFCPWLSV